MALQPVSHSSGCREATSGAAACSTDIHIETAQCETLATSHLHSCYSTLGIPWQFQPISSLDWAVYLGLIFKLLLPVSASSLPGLKPKISYAKAKCCLQVVRAPIFLKAIGFWQWECSCRQVVLKGFGILYLTCMSRSL